MTIADLAVRRQGRVAVVAAAIVGAVAVGGIAVVLAADLPRQLIGGLCVIITIALMLLGVHIGIAMITASALGIFALRGAVGVNGIMLDTVFASVSSWQLSVIPLFLLMGIALWHGGLAERAFTAARLWTGKVPGGLAVGTNLAGAGFAAASGSSVAITSALGRVAIPEMLAAGYRPALATGSVAVVGTLGQIIPPSIMLIIYSGITQTPVGPQLIAGIVPGIIIAAAFILVTILWAVLRPADAPRAAEPAAWPARLRALGGLMPLVVVVLVSIGGLAAGLFTATEAASVGAFAALVVGAASLPRPQRGPRGVLRFASRSLLETATMTASIFLLVIGVGVMTTMMALSGLAQASTAFILSLDLSVFGFLLLLAVLYIILGMFLDELSMILITLPLLIAPLQELGVDLVWFGIYLMVLVQIGMVAPPVGLLSFVVHGLTKDPAVSRGRRISLVEVYRGVLPYIGAAILILLLLIAVPGLATWLPSMLTIAQ